MARRGSFAYNAGGTGRDLTATIKSLYDQQQSANDKAMFDGWQNGGLVDGKPVTAARILAYIQQRQSQYSYMSTVRMYVDECRVAGAAVAAGPACTASSPGISAPPTTATAQGGGD